MKIYAKEDQEAYEKDWSEQKLSILQSWTWGEVKGNPIRARLGSYPVTVLRKKFPGLGFSFGYIPHAGPKALFKTEHMAKLTKLARDNNLAFVLIEPYVDASVFTPGLTGIKPTGKKWIQSQYTIVSELSSDHEKTLASMRKKHRQYLRKAERLGVVFETDNSKEGLWRFTQIMGRLETSKSFLAFPESYFRKLWGKFEGTGRVHLHFAVNATEDLGAYLVIDGSDTTYQFWGGSTKQGRELYAAYVLTWGAMKESQERGLSYYDQWGVAKFDENGLNKKDEKYGISNFKIGFGGKLIAYAPQQALVLSWFKYRLYKMMITLHGLIITIKKRLR